MRRILFLPFLLLLLAACGGEGDGTGVAEAESAQEAIVLAASRTREAGSARVSFNAAVEGGAGEGSFGGEGAFSGRRGRMTMDLSGLGGGGAAFAGAKMEMVFDGLVFYLRFPPEIAQSLPGGKEWVRIDVAKLGQAGGIDFEQLMQLNQGDPTQSLAYLEAATEDFREVGSEQVRGGVETTHYRGTIDLEKVAAAAPAEAREAYERVIELTGQREFLMDVWVDADGLVRKLGFEQRLPDDSTIRLTQEIYDFGADVDVELPASEEVTDLTELIGGS